ncbi:MAG TPA: ATP-binding protein [Williamwhitmania sp.]|nr:ATP-binding protein [Williamwhitmania sp.]
MNSTEGFTRRSIGKIKQLIRSQLKNEDLFGHHNFMLEQDIVLQKLKEQLTVLQSISESVNGPFFSIDKAFKYTSFNKAHASAMKSLYNVTIELEHGILDYVTKEEDRERTILNLTRALNGEHLIEESFIGELQSSRTYSELTHKPIYDDNQRLIGVSVMNRDVTKRKRADDKLHASEVRYRRLFEAAQDGILILDAISGEIVDVNPFITNMLKYSHQELLGKELWEIGAFKNIVASKEGFVELQKEEYIRFEDMPLETKAGKLISVEFISNVYLADNKKVIQCNIRNISERKLAEEQLLIAKNRAEESDRLKIAFLHNISHEIRTPMNAIVGFAGFLDDPNLLPEKRKQYTDIIIQSSDHLLSIISDIVSIASIEAGQENILEDEVNINLVGKFIQDQFCLKSANPNVALRFQASLADDKATIVTDATKFKQILTNLVGNALKFTNQGHVNFGYKLNENQLEFYVEDSGIGISPDMYEEIFKRFRQVETDSARKYGGSGLGLSLSKAYVEMLGGKIWLVSEMDKGSVFYFTLPYEQEKLNDLSDDLSAKSLAFELKKPVTLLIAEDEDSNFMLIEEFLSEQMITIIRVINGTDAVALCKSNSNIDMVLMDIKMPEMDGFEATNQIKRFRPNLPIIAQTAYAGDVDKNRALAYGCSDYICKPYKKEMLLAKVYEFLPK